MSRSVFWELGCCRHRKLSAWHWAGGPSLPHAPLHGGPGTWSSAAPWMAWASSWMTFSSSWIALTSSFKLSYNELGWNKGL